MGCGASSTSGTTTSADSTQLHTMHSTETLDEEEEDATQQQHRQSIEAPIDRRNALRNFNHLESSIQTMEETKCFEKYRVLTDDADQLKKQLQVFTEDANQTNNQIFSLVESGKLSGDDSLQSLIIDRWMQNSKISAKDVNAIEMLSNQEMLDIKAGLAQKDIERLENDAREAKKVCDQLQELYQQRDTILNQLFDGSYGNEKEMLLEREVDSLMEERHYIEIAKMRWVSSSRLISEAIKCLESGADKLRQYEGINENSLEERYNCIVAARTSFTTYLYKVSAVQGTLLNVKLPHLKEEDLQALEKCTRELFLDSFATANRLNQTLELVTSLRTKTVTQQSWVKTVLNSTIKTDLLEIREKCMNKGHELRFERALLIKQRLEQELAQQNSGDQSAKTSDSPFDLRVDSGVDSELGVDESALSSEEQMARILASGKYSELSANGTPLLPGEELGPIPSDSEIFGKIVQLRNRHNREMAEFEQNQRLIRVRIAQGLKDKLNDRRSRRSRMEMHRRHLEALQESPA